MKSAITAILLLATTLAFGQNPYVKMTTQNGVVTMKNTSGQGIVLLVGNITLNGKTLPHPDRTISQFHHEFFFNQGGFVAGDSMDWDTKTPGEIKGFDYSVVPTFIQFDDGTTWGTKDARAESVIASRSLKIAYLRMLADSASSEASFTAALNRKAANTSEAETQLRLQDWSMGVPAIIARVKQLLATGTARQNSGKF